MGSGGHGQVTSKAAIVKYSATGQDVVIWKEERGSRGKMGYSSSS